MGATLDQIFLYTSSMHAVAKRLRRQAQASSSMTRGVQENFISALWAEALPSITFAS